MNGGWFSNKSYQEAIDELEVQHLISLDEASFLRSLDT